MLSFLEEILSEEEIADLEEILNFSLNPKADLKELEEKMIFSNYYQAKLTRILLKLRLINADAVTEFEAWHSTQFHEVANNYDGYPELLKDKKDYEREIKKDSEYKITKSILRKLDELVIMLTVKDKELGQVQWIVGRIYDLEKLRHGIQY